MVKSNVESPLRNFFQVFDVSESRMQELSDVKSFFLCPFIVNIDPDFILCICLF